MWHLNFGILHQFLSYLNWHVWYHCFTANFRCSVNVARFTRNIKCNFFCNFQTPWSLFLWSTKTETIFASIGAEIKLLESHENEGFDWYFRAFWLIFHLVMMWTAWLVIWAGAASAFSLFTDCITISIFVQCKLSLMIMAFVPHKTDLQFFMPNTLG